PSLWPAPRKTLVPAHWTYEQARGALDAAGRLINTALAERRNLILVNPAEGNTYGTTRTLVAAYQMIMPGEWARASPHAQCAAPHPRRRARHVPGGRRRQHFDGAGRRAAHAQLVDARPRQPQQGQRLLAGFPRRAAGAAARADVLRAHRGRRSC